MLIRVILPAPVSGSAAFAYQDRAAEFRPQWGSFPGFRGEHAFCSRERDHRQPVTFATLFVHASHPNGDGARSVEAKGSRDNLCPLMLLWLQKNGGEIPLCACTKWRVGHCFSQSCGIVRISHLAIGMRD